MENYILSAIDLAHKGKLFYFINNSKNKLRSVTITNVKLDGDIIYCAYNLSIGMRTHHLPTIDLYELPEIIIGSDNFEYFSQFDKEFLLSCKICNEISEFRKQHPYYKIERVSTGRKISIIMRDSQDCLNMKNFTIDDLAKFTTACRKYKTPTEVEKIIISIFQ